MVVAELEALWEGAPLPMDPRDYLSRDSSQMMNHWLVSEEQRLPVEG